MGLREYFRKRKFSKTPEPKGKVGERAQHKPLHFVIHKHHASQLHYDLRLECDGVLKSWAVPKGPSLNPHDRHLAVRVEDHPLEYRNFEGVIPEDNYGAGEVIIWDRGTFLPRHKSTNPEATMRRKLKGGKFAFVLDGQKLKGEFALVRMHGNDKTWLLIKKKDEFVDTHHDITKEAESVKSGKTVEDLAETPELTDAPKSKLPKNITPMLSTLVETPFSREGWLFEIKWDGYRAIGTKQKGDVELYSRNGLDFRTKFPEVTEALHSLKDEVVLDGEVVSIDADGKPHFEWLQNWRKNHEGSLRYYVFDILWYQGRDLQKLPLIERKKILKAILPKKSILTYSDHVSNDGEGLFQQADRQGLEGIIAKEAGSAYLAGIRSRHWLKIKTHQRQEIVIGGFTEGQGTRTRIGALLVGVYQKGEFVFTGHVNAGMAEKDREQLYQKLLRLERQSSPFNIEPKPNTIVHWVTPKLVGEVLFAEWTPDGMMRQPEFKGLRPDKKPTDVKREKIAHTPPPSHAAKSTERKLHVQTTASAAPSKSPTTLLGPDFTHLDKIFWPELGLTKGDLLAYYQAVGPSMLPYLTDRPHSLNRQPGGYKDHGFFQKDTTSLHLPKFTSIQTVHATSTNQSVRYLVCNNLETLLYMAQLGCIEINPWSSRTAHLTKPDWAVIDLDPEGVGFTDVIEVAQTVHQVCEEWHIPHFPKTSGKTGIHIFIPTAARYTYAQVRDLAHLIVMEVNKRQPKLTSLERSPAKRHHRIYLDYLQNSEGQTLAAPYSARPTKAASVSAPLHWDEVKAGLKPEQFTIKNMPDRLERVGDVWQPVIGEGVAIAKLLSHLESANK